MDDKLKHILDFDRLMEGENRKSADPDDIKHWQAVYADLVSFKKLMLDRTHQHIAEVPSTEPELGKNDVPFLEAEMERLEKGLQFWERRRSEAGG